MCESQNSQHTALKFRPFGITFCGVKVIYSSLIVSVSTVKEVYSLIMTVLACCRNFELLQRSWVKVQLKKKIQRIKKIFHTKKLTQYLKA